MACFIPAIRWHSAFPAASSWPPRGNCVGWKSISRRCFRGRGFESRDSNRRMKRQLPVSRHKATRVGGRGWRRWKGSAAIDSKRKIVIVFECSPALGQKRFIRSIRFPFCSFSMVLGKYVCIVKENCSNRLGLLFESLILGILPLVVAITGVSVSCKFRGYQIVRLESFLHRKS